MPWPQAWARAAQAQHRSGQQRREQGGPVQHAHQRQRKKNQSDQHQRRALVPEVEMALDPVHREGQQGSGSHRTSQQIGQVQQRGERALRAVRIQHAQQQAGDDQGIERIERGQQQQSLRHLPVGPKLAADAQRHRRRSRHQQAGHCGRLQPGKSEKQQGDKDRSEPKRRLQQAHGQQGRIGAQPAQIHPVPDFKQQHRKRGIDNRTCTGLQGIDVQAGTARGDDHARRRIAHQSRPAQETEHRLPGQRRQHQRGAHPEHPIGAGRPCGQETVDHRAGSPGAGSRSGRPTEEARRGAGDRLIVPASARCFFTP
ncbi:hypothetical protein GALL_450250 [mine drainage metagenome]|uniref:Uncharacterized protein n=1 Tax=mine drainage metagenome TaxID=410659 RepID=A0A1J5PQC9_9ZZZZ